MNQSSKMKRILLPTDKSKNAEHALNYVLQLFEGQEAEFILFQSIEIPIYSADMPVPMMLDETEAYRRSLEETASKLQKAHKATRFIFSSLVESGSLSFNVERLVETDSIDLIVMGTKGASGLAAALIGSNTSDVIAIAKCPVLAVPAGADLSKPNEILFATDHKGISNKDILNPLFYIAKKFESHIHLLNVLDEGDLTSVDEAVEGLKLDHLLENVLHTFHIVNANDKVSTIENYVRTNNINLLVVIPRHNDFFSSIFHSSVTRKLALHSTVPLLTLYDSAS